MAFKDRVKTVFPAVVSATSPLTLVKSGLSYVFGLDVQALLQSINPYFIPIVAPTLITFANSPYTPTADIQVLLVDTAGGAITINMPLSSARVFDLEIKDVTGHAAANPISVTFSGGQSADGLTPYLLDSNYAAAKFGVKPNGFYVHA